MVIEITKEEGKFTEQDLIDLIKLLDQKLPKINSVTVTKEQYEELKKYIDSSVNVEFSLGVNVKIAD